MAGAVWDWLSMESWPTWAVALRNATLIFGGSAYLMLARRGARRAS